MIAACVKFVDLRPEVDPIDGRLITHAQTAGISDADAAALEWALRCGERWGRPVAVVSASQLDPGSMLRDAIACGASRAVHVEISLDAPSAGVAAAVAPVLRELGATTVWCGAHSLDRGSGAVPACLAAELGLAQALGLVDVTIGTDGEVGGLRRLDGGRREDLRVRGGGVLSVEGSTARLRRAPLPAALSAREARVETRRAAMPARLQPVVRGVRPYRPRARVRPAPRGVEARDRIVALTTQVTADGHPELLVLDPAAAGDRIMAALADWGYLPGDR
jgi:electron transfer flavoprotein beta subunit